MHSKVATIVPRAHLEQTKADFYFMALSYAADDKEYADFFRERAIDGKFTILDNSAVELGQPENVVSYAKKAAYMHISEVMLPDVFKDPAETLRLSTEALIHITHHISLDGASVMVIPQGNSWKEWRQSMFDLWSLVIRFGRLPTIGISCRYTDMFGGSRSLPVAFAQELTYSKIHLLGCWSDPRDEVRPLLSMDKVRSIDSSYPSVYAHHDMVLHPEDFAKPRPPRDLNFLTDAYDPALLEENMRAWRLSCEPLLRS